MFHPCILLVPFKDITIPDYTCISKVALYMGVPDNDLIFRVSIDSFEVVNHSIIFSRFFNYILGLLVKEAVSLYYNPPVIYTTDQYYIPYNP